MKIVHVVGYFNESLSYQENTLVIGLKELGHDVFLITSCYEPEFKNNKGNRKKTAGISYYHGVQVHRVEDYLEVRKNGLVLMKPMYKIFKKIKPDIIFFHDVSFWLFEGVIYKFFNREVKLHIDFHSDFENAFNTRIAKLWHLSWRLFFTLFQSSFSRKFCISPETKLFIHKIYGINTSDLKILPLPGDNSYIAHRESIRKKYITKYSLDPGVKIIVHAGKLPQKKETLLTLKSFVKLKDPNICLFIAGSIDGHFENDLNYYLNKDKRIFYLGWLDSHDLKNLFSCCDLFVQVGGLSQLFIDAICCGLPILLYDTLQGKYLTSFGNGLLIKKKCEKELVSAILFMLEDSNLCVYKKNSVIASEYFHYKKIAETTTL